jgi:hypothetical protein
VKVNVTARYTVWIDKDVEAENEEAALDQALDSLRDAFRNIDGVIETDLGDCETSPA